MKQNYQAYTPEEHKVWKLLFDQQIEQIKKLASIEYLKGMAVCRFDNAAIPHIEEVNSTLLSATGWSIEIVPGLIDNHSFFKLLSQKKFPASTWIRTMEALDYLEEPDMFHDILGHVPLLANVDFCTFLAALAATALKFIDDGNAIELISRLYWYSVEFGLIVEDGVLKIYGAGILSSRAETYYCIHGEGPQRKPFNVKEILSTPYIKEKFQETYFIIHSYADLHNCIDGLEHCLSQVYKHRV